MSSPLHRLITLLLCLSLLPGWGELLENAEHLVHDGHLAHLVGHDNGEDIEAHESIEAEHGCTPVSHTCPCHASIPAILPSDVAVEPGRAVATHNERVPEHAERPWQRSNAPPVPPPKA